MASTTSWSARLSITTSASRAASAGESATRAPSFADLLRLRPRAVVDGDLVAGLRQPRGHADAHDAEADEGDALLVVASCSLMARSSPSRRRRRRCTGRSRSWRRARPGRATVAAISPARRSGRSGSGPASSARSAGPAPASWTSSVGTKPGATPLTVMRCRPHSVASCLTAGSARPCWPRRRRIRGGRRRRCASRRSG